MNVSISRCRSIFLLFVSSFLLCASASAAVAPADVDAGFGQSGVVLTDFIQSASAQIVLVQPDNKIIVGGTVNNAVNTTNYDFGVTRFNADGSSDNSFGTLGRVVTAVSLNRDTVGSGALQPDGKILLGGETAGRFAVVRYNQDGSLDMTFGESGKVITDFGTAGAVINSILIQPDGKIVAVGQTGHLDIHLARYFPNGTPDESFGTQGRVSTRYVPQGNGSYSAVLQPDGKILVGGSINTDAASDFALFRYNTNGTLDTSFDGDGVAVSALSPSHDRIKKVLLRPDGKILVVGSAVDAKRNISDYAFGVYNSDGSRDNSFGQNGFLIMPATGNIEVSDALLQPDGKIVVGGTKSPDFVTRLRFHAARFNADGSFDLTFGNSGKMNLPVGLYSTGWSIAIQPDNKILIAGTGTNINDTRRQIALVRLAGGNGAMPSAAAITGRVINSLTGRGVGGVQVILTRGANASPLYARTNPFGFYRFVNLPVNTEYNLTIKLKRTPEFQTSAQLLLNGNEYAEDLTFRY
jgi:uncharacterized delta-60 repeat protein